MKMVVLGREWSAAVDERVSAYSMPKSSDRTGARAGQNGVLVAASLWMIFPGGSTALLRLICSLA